MTGQRAPRRVTVRPELIIDTAVELTSEVGLSGWSVRDIQSRLGASMSSIYHHVGSRPELAGRVVERVLEGIRVPPAHLDWREWYTELLLAVRERLSGYPGVAHWMLMHSPSFAQIMPVLDIAISHLRHAGFGANTGFAYSVIFNSAIGAIATADDRLHSDDDGPRDHRHVLDRLRAVSDASPGGQTLLETIAPFADDKHTAQQAADAYYRRLLTVIFDGLESLRVSPRD